MALAAVVRGAEAPRPRLADYYEQRIGEIEPLLTGEEVDLWESLDDDGDRERFLRSFWSARGEASRLRLVANDEAARRMGFRAVAKHRVVRLAGLPSEVVAFASCRTVARRLEVWHYPAARVAHQRRLSGAGDPGPGTGPGDRFIVFLQATEFDPRSFGLWSPGDDAGRLVFGDGVGLTPSDVVGEALALGCLERDDAALLRRALEEAVGFAGLPTAFGWPTPAPWWRAGKPLGAPLPDEPATFELRPAGRFFRQTLLQGSVSVPVSSLRTLDGEAVYDRVEILGDVYRGDRLVDGFRVVHHIAGSAGADRLDLDLYRRLAPGTYTLDLRALDSGRRTLVRHRGELVVPETDAEVPPLRRSRDLNDLTRDDVVFLTLSPSVEVLTPETFPVAGDVTVEAVARGDGVRAVSFVTGDGARSVDEEAPYLARIAFRGSRMGLEVRALDGEGQVLAEDTVTLRRDAVPFLVWFSGEEGGEHLVTVQVPEEERLEEVACFRNGARVRTLRPEAGQTGFRCPRQGPAAVSARPRFDRVTARLASGETVEDVRFADAAPESVDVRLVELFVSVLDAQGRPVTGLAADRFTVLEEGEPQPVERVATVDRLPLSVGVVMDVSSSMGRRVRLAGESTARFFREVLREGDAASLFAFHHDLLPLVDFTGDEVALAVGAQGVRARGGTRLHDALIYDLHSFVGLPARRALVLLSDGADTESDADFDDVLEAVRRSGVLIFPVALGDVGAATLEELQVLAARSGGRFFQASGVDGLDAVYRQVERLLRSQYQVVYRPGEGGRRRGYRQVEILLDDETLTVRNVRGYYR